MVREAVSVVRGGDVLPEPNPSFAPNLNGILTDFASGASTACTVVSMAGRILRVRAGIQLPLEASVKVEDSQHMWAGEVWACDPLADSFVIEIQTALMLTDLAAVESLANRFMHRRGDRASGESGFSIPVARRRENPTSED